MFRGVEAEIRSIAAHNVHENVGRVQEGGTSMILYGPLLEQYNFKHSGKDDTGIGRWVVIVFQGSKGIKTIIVCSYISCYNKNMESSTSYQQQHRYLLLKEKDRTCQSKRLNNALIRQLQNWWEEGDRIILCMDTNEYIYKKSLGKYITARDGLNINEVVWGRWVVIVFQGSKGIKTIIVCSYISCYNKNMESSTSYQQQHRYLLLKEKDRTCQSKRLNNALIRQLQNWWEEGDRIILCMDTNEYIYKKSLGKYITARDGLNINEVVWTLTGKNTGETFFRVSQPIDAVWITPDIVVVGLCVILAGYEVSDNCLFVLDFLTSSLIGKTPLQIIRSGARRLNTKIPSTKDNYTNVLENLVVSHRLTEQMVAAHNESSSIVMIKERICIIDQEVVKYMHHVERKCRRIKSGRIPFSPDFSIWIRRCQLYCSILRYHYGKIRNRRNLKQSAQRCGIGGTL